MIGTDSIAEGSTFPAGAGARRRLPPAWGIALGYALLATLWIAASDRALARVVPDPASFLLAGIYKGFAFVALTATLLLIVLRRAFATADAHCAALQASEAQLRHDMAERRRAEALALSEKRFSDTMIDSMPGVIYFFDQDGNFLRWNRNLERVSGYSTEEIARMRPLEFFAVADRPLIEARIAETLALGESSVEARLLAKDGSTRSYMLSGRRVEYNGASCLLGSGIDIEALKEAEISLARSEAEATHLAESLTTTLESITDAFVTLDREGRFTYLNREAERLVRRPRAELAGTAPWDAFPDDVGATFEKMYQLAIGGNRTVSFDQYFPSLQRWLEIHAYPSTQGLAAHLRDVTQRHLDQEQLHQAEARIREQASLLDKAQDAIIVGNLDHEILYWNRSAERLYGWTSAEAVGRSVTELMYDNTRAFDAAMHELLASGEWVGEIEHLTKNRRSLVVEGHWTLVRDDTGAPTSVLAINTDITRRRQLEQQYLRAQRLESVGTLAGGIAHDINNVLTPIVMSIGLLQMDEQDEDRLELLATIEGSAKRGAQMVSQVLSFARGTEVERVEVQITHLIAEIVNIVRETFPKNIDVRDRLSPDLRTLQADPTQLHQVLLNLLVNARDALPAGGSVTVSAENVYVDAQLAAANIEAQIGPYVKIEVEDTGTGIPRDIIDKVFDPFFTTKAVGHGTGLGLATSLAIVKSHGGFINVYSDEGVGTCFRVYLPALRRAESDVPEGADGDPPRGHGETVLVVDDESSIRQIARQTLEAHGYRVLLAGDGAEALSSYEQHAPTVGVVLTDVMMPVMDGITLARALARRNPELPIIATSGLTASTGGVRPDIVRHFLPKPYTATMLLGAVTRALHETS